MNFSRKADPTVSKSAFSKSDLFAGFLLSAFALAIHVVHLANAGALWRDEAAIVQLATLPRVSDMAKFFPHEAFPLLFPSLVRLWIGVFGDSDLGLRIIGLSIGCGLVIGLWWIGLRVWRSVPLLGLAVLGFNSAFLQWGDSIRAYGLGTLLLLLTVIAVWGAVEQPGLARLSIATVCAVASVQCLFQNAIFIFSICVGAAVASLGCRFRKVAALALLPGVVAALSLLPYWSALSAARDWDRLIHFDLRLRDVWLPIERALFSSGAWAGVLWIVVFVLGAAITLIAAFKPNALHLSTGQRQRIIFGGVTLSLGTVLYFLFLKSLGHPVRAWHVVVLIGFLGAFADLFLEPLRRWPAARKTQTAVALVIFLLSIMPSFRVAEMRQTNVDVIAATLKQVTSPEDLIVVTPWYNAISFHRYYKGPASWTTAPPLDFNLFHRYDLIKSLMTATNQQAVLEPVLARIENCFRGGHRVWLVGENQFAPSDLQIGTPPPAPTQAFGWQEQPYTLTWTLQTELYLRKRSARVADVAVPSEGPVSQFENLWLKGFEAEPGS